MNLPSVRFNKQDQPEFFKELKKRVNLYFQENQISKHANFNMKFKTIFMFTIYFTPLVLMLAGAINAFGWALVMWVIMGFGLAGIGCSVMHDANHGSYSKNKYVNKFLGFTSNFLGGFHKNWKIQHNVLHHSFTNIHHMDEDIEKGVFCLSPNQKPDKIHRFQAFYAPFLYGLLTIFWFSTKDFQALVRYKKKDLLAAEGMTFWKAVLEVAFHKLWYLAIFLVLPMIFLDMPWWQTLIGFLIMHFIGGATLSFIFQAAHVLEETDFFELNEKGSMENNWAIHQMRTTANFGRRNGFFSWFIGGLNYQIEHHLFPNICHIHYARISKIVKETAEEYGIPYLQHRNFLLALKSHFTMIHQLGTGKYQRELAKA